MNPRMNAIIMRKGCKSNLSFNFKELKNHAASVKHTIYFMKSSSFCILHSAKSIKEWFRLRFLEERCRYVKITCVRPRKQVGRANQVSTQTVRRFQIVKSGHHWDVTIREIEKDCQKRDPSFKISDPTSCAQQCALCSLAAQIRPVPLLNEMRTLFLRSAIYDSVLWTLDFDSRRLFVSLAAGWIVAAQ